MIEKLPDGIGGWVAAGVMAAGVLAAKLSDKFFPSMDKERDREDKRHEALAKEEGEFRKALRQQIEDLKADMAAIKEANAKFEEESVKWRDRYYQKAAENLDLYAKYQTLQSAYATLQADNGELKADYAELSAEFHTIKVQLGRVLEENKQLKIRLGIPATEPEIPKVEEKEEEIEDGD